MDFSAEESYCRYPKCSFWIGMDRRHGYLTPKTHEKQKLISKMLILTRRKRNTRYP